MASTPALSFVRLAVSACLVLAAAQAWPIQRGTTPQGVRHVSGGIGQEELVALLPERERHSLWVITAALRSGAYLAQVQLAIRDARGNLVFSGVMDGPWLFIDLPLGAYNVEARLGTEVNTRTTTIHVGDHHQVFFYFRTGDEVSPEGPGAPASAPYGAPRPK